MSDNQSPLVNFERAIKKQNLVEANYWLQKIEDRGDITEMERLLLMILLRTICKEAK